MSILQVQRRYRELGRLRLGQQVKTRGGKMAPAKLDTWRLTSPSADLLGRAAEAWGGTVEVWDEAPSQGEQFELVTEAKALEVYVPPQDLERSQYMELWKAGGVSRRCDMETELISGRACICDPDKRDCTITTHLQVILPQVPDVGVWRMTTRGWNAAAELPATVEMLRKIHAEGAIPAAVLEIEPRTVKRGNETHHFVVPILRLPYSILEAHQRGLSLLPSGKPALGERPELPADASFTEDAPWGPPPEIPGAEASAPTTETSTPAPEPAEPSRTSPDDSAPVVPEGSTPSEPSGDGLLAQAVKLYGTEARVLSAARMYHEYHKVEEIHDDDLKALIEKRAGPVPDTQEAS